MVVRRGDSEAPDRLFGALSDATRRDIVAVVLQSDQSVSDLAARYPMSFAAVQKHVAVLERAGLVVKHRRGREQRIRGAPQALRDARTALEAMESRWRNRVEQIDLLVQELTPLPDAPLNRKGAPPCR